MKTISIVNLKGGGGKTITSVNMAAILAAEYSKRVLVVDADPQANTTRFFGLRGDDCNTIAGIMSGYANNIDDYIYPTKYEDVFCIPSEISLIEADIASVQTGTGAHILKDFLAAVEEDNRLAKDTGDAPYDYCLIDCPPSFTAASVAAIAASDEIIIPIKIDNFSMDGMTQLITQIDSVKQIRPSVKVSGILVTMWYNAPAVVQGEELLRKSGLPVFTRHIRRSDKVDESTFARQPLCEYSPTSGAGRDYSVFVAEYLEGVR